MIVGIGIDTVSIEKIKHVLQRHPDAFINRILSEKERIAIAEHITSSKSYSHRFVEFLAGRFAAKEAISKALGSGIGKVSWHDLQILRLESGAPIIELQGYGSELSQSKNIQHWHVSI